VPKHLIVQGLARAEGFHALGPEAGEGVIRSRAVLSQMLLSGCQLPSYLGASQLETPTLCTLGPS